MRPTRPSIRAAFARYLPAALLVAVAVNQQRLAHVDALSPWSGGGFGMFSVTDSPANRYLHASVENENLIREVRLPESWEERVRRATTLPTRQRLVTLAKDIAELESAGKLTWDRVTVQVWGVSYDPVTLTPSGTLLRAEHVDVRAR